jgi:small subunit ribosomal protein S18
MAMRKRKKKVIIRKNLSCPFNKNPENIDYKDVHTLKKYITTRGRMISSTRTGVSQRCQRKLAKEIKKARYMALLPYNQIV